MNRVNNLYFAGYECSCTEQDIQNQNGTYYYHCDNNNNRSWVVLRNTEKNTCACHLLPSCKFEPLKNAYVESVTGSNNNNSNNSSSIDHSKRAESVHPNCENSYVADINTSEIDICYVYSENEWEEECNASLLSETSSSSSVAAAETEAKNNNNFDHDTCIETSKIVEWVHGRALEHVSLEEVAEKNLNAHVANESKEGNNNNSEYPRRVILLGYMYNNDDLCSTAKRDSNKLKTNNMSVYVLSETPSNEAEIWKCDEVNWLATYYSLVNTDSTIKHLTQYQQLLSDNSFTKINTCQFPVMLRTCFETASQSHDAFWFSPILQRELLTQQYKIMNDWRKVYYLRTLNEHVHFVGVSCAVPWVCKVCSEQASTSSLTLQPEEELESGKEQKEKFNTVYVFPLARCYTREALIMEYGMCDEEENAQVICKTARIVAEFDNTENIKQKVNIDERSCTSNNYDSQVEAHFAKCVHVRQNKAVVKGAYGVTLTCEINSPLLSQLQVAFKDRLIYLPKWQQEQEEQEELQQLRKKENASHAQCTVVGTCGEHLVVLYDHEDVTHVIREFALHSWNDLAAHFARKDDIASLTTRKNIEGSTICKCEEKNLEHELNIERKSQINDNNNDENNFTNFLVAYAVEQLQHNNLYNDNSHSTQVIDSNGVFEYYYCDGHSCTLERIMSAWQAYQARNTNE